MKKWFQENQKKFEGQIFFNEPLSKHTYFKIGGPSSVLIIPKSEQDLVLLSKGLKETCAPFFFLGAGSNLLVSDQGFSGVVVKTSKLNLSISLGSQNEVMVGSSVMVSSFLRKISEEGWGGLEFLTGIPGTMGGVVWMNAGTHLGEAQSRLKQVDVFEMREGQLNKIVFYKKDLNYRYRKNMFLENNMLIYSMIWEIDLSSKESVEKKISETLKRRKETQPLDAPSCGSVFKNPKSTGLSAWQVIEKVGLRGYTIGRAQFSEKHCNFILNLGGAHASDVVALIQLAKQKASSELGLDLEEEVVYLGFA